MVMIPPHELLTMDLDGDLDKSLQAKRKEQASKAYCHKCNNEGLAGGCPRCGKFPVKYIAEAALQMDIPTDIIPTHYQGKLWEKPVVTDGMEYPLTYKQVDDAMDKVLSKFLQGEIPTFSLFIASPPKTGKNLFAFSCMQTSVIKRMAVAPYLSTGDWRRMHSISQMNPFLKLYGKYTWDTLVASDVVFLYVDHSDEHKTDIPLLKSILDSRASFGKATFIMSDYRLQDLVPSWKSDMYSMIHNPAEDRDYLRYPVILQRF